MPQYYGIVSGQQLLTLKHDQFRKQILLFLAIWLIALGSDAENMWVQSDLPVFTQELSSFVQMKKGDEQDTQKQEADFHLSISLHMLFWIWLLR